MKWFEHDVDMHTDLKIQSLIDKHGLKGYAIWNLCLELVGKEGKKGKLDGQTRWQEGLIKVYSRSIEGKDKVELEIILNDMSELKLICSKALKYGNLYIPNFMKRADNYTRRLLRKECEQGSNKVPLHYNTLQDITLHYIKAQGWYESLKDNKQLTSDTYKRNCRPAKALYMALGDTSKVCGVITKMAESYKQKGLSWTLETVLRHLPELLKEEPKRRILQ